MIHLYLVTVKLNEVDDDDGGEILSTAYFSATPCYTIFLYISRILIFLWLIFWVLRTTNAT